MFFLSSTIHVRYGFPNKQFKECNYAYVKNSDHRPTLYHIYIYIIYNIYIYIYIYVYIYIYIDIIFLYNPTINAYYGHPLANSQT